MKTNWTDKELSGFKEGVMRRVYLAWFMKKVAIPAFLILPLAALALLKELSQINLQIIFQNTLDKLALWDPAAVFSYFFYAIRYTELDSLLILTSSTLLAAFFGRRLIRDVWSFWFGDSLRERLATRERHL